jgi:glycosidase
MKTLVAEAHERGMVVITDLVMNHTSNQHPWFIDAQVPGSEHENWYIWQPERQDYASPWGSPVWYKSGLRYYYALFWEGMPDLNYNNGAVTEAMFDAIRFWLEELGVDGFRLDAVRHLIEDGPVQENTPATHTWLQNFHRYVHSLNPQAFTVGEAWTETSEVVKYVGDEVDIAFEFDLAQGMLQSVWSGSNSSVIRAQAKVLDSFPHGQYGAFLTNHDQNRVMNQVLNDPEAAKVAATLLLTNPGVPFIYYGEEIGMSGEKPDERIRTPMQWDGSPAAGFTTGTPWQELAGGFSRINVAVEEADPDSLLNHYRKLIRLRQDHPSLRTGDMQLVDSDSRQVYSFILYTDQEIFLLLLIL